jgi:hypothetical protein
MVFSRKNFTKIQGCNLRLPSRVSGLTRLRSFQSWRPLSRAGVPRILGAVVRIEGCLDGESGFAAFICAGFEPTTRSASPGCKGAVLQPDKLSSHGRIFLHRFERLAVILITHRRRYGSRSAALVGHLSDSAASASSSPHLTQQVPPDPGVLLSNFLLWIGLSLFAHFLLRLF